MSFKQMGKMKKPKLTEAVIKEIVERHYLFTEAEWDISPRKQTNSLKLKTHIPKPK